MLRRWRGDRDEASQKRFTACCAESGLAESGKVLGRFKATGIRPHFYEKLKACGIVLPTSLFQTVVEIGQN